MATAGEGSCGSIVDMDGCYYYDGQPTGLLEYHDVGSEEEEDLPDLRPMRRGSKHGELAMDVEGRIVYLQRKVMCSSSPSPLPSPSRGNGALREDGRRDIVDVRRISAEQAYEENLLCRRLVKQERLQRRFNSPTRLIVKDYDVSMGCQNFEKFKATDPELAASSDHNDKDPQVSPKSVEHKFNQTAGPLENSLENSPFKTFCAICREYIFQNSDGVNRHECPRKDSFRDGR